VHLGPRRGDDMDEAIINHMKKTYT